MCFPIQTLSGIIETVSEITSEKVYIFSSFNPHTRKREVFFVSEDLDDKYLEVLKEERDERGQWLQFYDLESRQWYDVEDISPLSYQYRYSKRSIKRFFVGEADYKLAIKIGWRKRIIKTIDRLSKEFKNVSHDQYFKLVELSPLEIVIGVLVLLVVISLFINTPEKTKSANERYKFKR